MQIPSKAIAQTRPASSDLPSEGVFPYAADRSTPYPAEPWRRR